MIFDEIVLHNFSVYRDRQIINLTPPSAEKPVILFGGINGGGKTTLLDALQLALYGKFAQCSNRGNLGYEEFLRRSIHRGTNPKVGAAVELAFRHRANGVEHSYRVNRIWRENGKSIKETVEVLKDGSLDHVLTDAWYEQVNKFLPIRLSNLFFFDGEKIEAFADIENSATILSQAIHSLLGVDIVDRLFNDLGVLQRRKKIEQKSEVDQKLIMQMEAELDHLTQRRAAIEQEKGKAQNDLDRYMKELRQINAEYQKEGGELFDKRVGLEKDRAIVAEKVQDVRTRLRELAIGPAPLLLVLDDLRAIQQQDREEQKTRESEFLTGVLEERDQAVLQEIASSGYSKGALKSLEDFLDQDRNQRIESKGVKCYLDLDEDTRQNHHSLLTAILPAVKRKADRLLEAQDLFQKQLDNLDRKLADVPDQDKLALIIKEREKTTKAIEQSRMRLNVLAKEKKSLRYAFEMKEKQLLKLINKKVAIQLELEDINRVIIYANKVQNTLTAFRSALVERHVKNIASLILDCFQQLLRKKSLIKNLTISPKTFAMELQDAKGNVLFPDRLSAGERQLLAISMLWGLARASGRALPTIVDTPLGRLDTAHRIHLVDRYFPHASHQVLLLSTDEEIDETYYKKLKPRIGHAYHLAFDDERDGTQVEQGYFW